MILTFFKIRKKLNLITTTYFANYDSNKYLATLNPTPFKVNKIINKTKDDMASKQANTNLLFGKKTTF